MASAFQFIHARSIETDPCLEDARNAKQPPPSKRLNSSSVGSTMSVRDLRKRPIPTAQRTPSIGKDPVFISARLEALSKDAMTEGWKRRGVGNPVTSDIVLWD